MQQESNKEDYVDLERTDFLEARFVVRVASLLSLAENNGYAEWDFACLRVLT
jgi:hypothetical protein